ncbi:iron chelate uptake ABC transporter family permease subunit, partial [Cellulomonas telluris]|uniref:iron chelate uptake ABC transporter family permease subunit n=1 Tax=Cellulomonas telluris TaxID=2306636 RepID=UPI001CA3AC16
MASDTLTSLDVLGLVRVRRRTSAWVVGLSVGLLATVLAGVGIGAVAVPAATVAEVVGHHVLGWPGERSWSAPVDAIVWQVRLPRVLLGVLVGAGLAICGVTLQAM